MENEKEYILSTAGNRFTEIPKEIWQHHVELAPKDISKKLSFMTPMYHRVRYFVVMEMPRIGKPIKPERISEELNISLSETTGILDDLESHLFFLVRNEQGAISWAFPVTVDNTPHQLTFSTGERLNAA